MISTTFMLLCLLVLTPPAAHTAQTRQPAGKCSWPGRYSVSHSQGNNTAACTSANSTTPCKSLDYLLQHVHNCAAITILDAVRLTGSLVLNSSTDLTIMGYKPPVNISCAKGSGMAFVNSQQVSLQGLQFVGCSMPCPNGSSSSNNSYPLADYAALCFHQGSDLSISGCSFLDGVGTGVILQDVTGNNELKDSNFTRNRQAPNIAREATPYQTFGGLIVKTWEENATTTYILDNCHFDENENNIHFGSGDNYRGLGGGAYFYLAAQKGNFFIQVHHSEFIRNVGVQGGGMHVNQTGNHSSLSVHVSYTSFQSNQAGSEGGGLWLTQDSSCLFCTCQLQLQTTSFGNNSGKWGGGMSVYSDNRNGSILVEAQDSKWIRNNANISGHAVGIYLPIVRREFPGNGTIFPLRATFAGCYFLNNTYEGHYTNYNSMGAVQVGGVRTEFVDCSFQGNAETALWVYEFAYCVLAGNTTFKRNRGLYGGAIHVDGKSATALKEGAFLRFEDNAAIIEGGAIYSAVVDQDLTSVTLDNICVFDGLGAQLKSSDMIRVHFAHNKPQSMFVGSSVGCVNQNATNSSQPDYYLIFDSRFFSYEVPPNSRQLYSQVVSTARTITLNSSTAGSDKQVQVMLGESFNLNPNVVDVFGNPAYLFGNLQLVRVLDFGELEVPDDLKLMGPSMISMDNYTNQNALYYITGSKSRIGDENLHVAFVFDSLKTLDYHKDYQQLQIKLVDCKAGYMYNPTSEMCDCIKWSDNVVCSPHSSTSACVRSGYWFGYYNDTGSDVFPCPGQYCNYIKGSCPDTPCPGSPDFCLVEDPDQLCFEGRSGIMCSACRVNYSFTFNALRCVPDKSCTGIYTALIVLGLVVYWGLVVGFVLVILSVDLSVGLGFLYGIVYYFSVLSLFTDVTITGPVLQTFVNTCIALTQLCPRAFGDLDVCFVGSWDLNLHHHMFHYVTPIAVITVILLVILAERHCPCCPKALSLAQHSPIHAICVLVLFSYTSLTYTCFQILQPIKVNNTLRVYADPELAYFGSEHLPYALVALLLEVFVSLPICFLLLLAPLLVRKVNVVQLKVKPLLDDFQACYRPKCRWFAGYYFLARQVVFLANAIPRKALPQDTTTLHYANALVFIVHSIAQPYKSKWLNTLDTLLLLDVCFLSFFDLDWNINFMHRAIPYLLILPPVFYLLSVIVLIVCKRFWACFCSKRTLRATLKRRKQEVSESSTQPPPTSITIGLDEEKKHDPSGSAAKSLAFMGSDFFRDTGEREPLLSDTASSSDRAEAGRAGRARAGTYTSSVVGLLSADRNKYSTKKSATN